MRESAVRNSPLPPSIEKAYHQKCIDLKRRLREIEDANDAATQRKARLDRSITKMRIMRAFLLEQLVRSQDYDDAESEKSESAPPTPREPPPRLRRSNHRRSPGPVNGHPHAGVSSPPDSLGPAYATPGNPYAQLSGGPSMAQVHPPPSGTGARFSAASHVNPPHAPHHGPDALPTDPSPSGYPAELPLIHSLPNGTSVMLIGPGEPKRAPWTIRDLGPQHQFKPDFDDWPAEAQETELFNGADGPYLPYDIYGNAITCEWIESEGRYRHVLPTDPNWQNQVANGMRMDGPEHGRATMVLGHSRERREEVDRRRAAFERERAAERERHAREVEEEIRRHNEARAREMRELQAAAPGAGRDARLTPDLSDAPGPGTPGAARDARNGAVGGAAGVGAGTPGAAAAGFTAANR